MTMQYQNRLYVLLHPTTALIGSQLTPEQLARHYTVGPTRHYRGKVVFAEVDGSFRNPYFRIDEAVASGSLAENEVLRAENSRLNAALVRISAIRRSVSVAADSVNYALEIADKALAEKPAPEIEHD